MKFTEINKQLLHYIIEATNKPELIKQILHILQKYDYAFIGGFAVSFYSKNARKISPEDIDIKILKTDVEKLKSELINNLNFKLTKQHYFDNMLWLILEKEGQGIDVAITDDELSVKGIKHSKIFNYKGVQIKVYNIKYLILDKLRSGRSKDYRDIVYLLKELSVDDIKLMRGMIKKYLGSDEYYYFDQLIQDKEYPDNVLNQLYK